MATEKSHLKSVLEEARVQIDHTVKRIDTANPEQLAEISGIARVAAAFVDFNGVCGKGRPSAAGHEMLEKFKG